MVDPLSSGSRDRPAGATDEHRLRPTVERLRGWVGRWSVSGWTVVALTLLAALPRLWDLGGPSFWNDEGGSSIFALAALHSGLPLLPGRPLAAALVNFDPLYPELEAASFRLFGVSQVAARLPAALFGIAMVPLAYLVGRRLAERYVGLTFAVMVACSTEFIAWSRQARGYVVFAVLLLLMVYVAHRWYRERRLTFPTGAAMFAVAVGLALTSPGIFVLYAPAALGAGIAYLLLARRPAVVAFFGGPPRRWDDWRSVVRRRWRLGLLAGALILLAGVAADPPGPVARFLGGAFKSTLHFAPYPLIWVPFYGAYLLAYYAPVMVLAAFGALIALRRADPFELSVLVFGLLTLLSLSSVLSLVADAAGGAPTYERYLTPDLAVLFYFASLGLVGLGRIAYRAVRQLPVWLPRARGVPVLYVAVVVTVLVVPSMVYPPLLNTYPAPQFSPAGSEVPWSAFSPFPAEPSALYATPQPNFELACEYVVGHERPGDVTMAIWPDAPQFYLGTVTYWAYTNPPPGSAVAGPNGTEYFLTGSLQVPNASALEAILQRSGGWFVEDVVSQGALGTNLSMATRLFENVVPAGSDGSITLYHWNASSPTQLLRTLQDHRRDLIAGFGANLTKLIDWAVVPGVTIDGDRPLLLPLEAALVPLASPGIRPMAVLVEVYNGRPDLQSMFPDVVGFGNYSGLLHWADEVVRGTISDPAAPVLAPYATFYETNGG